MTWSPTGPRSVPIGQVLAPLILGIAHERFDTTINTIDDISSDCRALDLLSALLVSTKPERIVEVGTYRGMGTIVMAETVRRFNWQGHVWTCDPEDHNTAELFARVGLERYITYIQGTFEDLLQKVFPMDFCYIDASDKEEAGLRVRYCLMALEATKSGGMIVVDDAAGDWNGSALLRRMARRHGLYLPFNRGQVVLQV